MLNTNLVYLATIADSNQNMQSLLPAVSPLKVCEVHVCSCVINTVGFGDAEICVLSPGLP